MPLVFATAQWCYDAALGQRLRCSCWNCRLSTTIRLLKLSRLAIAMMTTSHYERSDYLVLAIIRQRWRQRERNRYPWGGPSSTAWAAVLVLWASLVVFVVSVRTGFFSLSGNHQCVQTTNNNDHGTDDRARAARRKTNQPRQPQTTNQSSWPHRSPIY
jgi:hypothetical protein